MGLADRDYMRRDRDLVEWRPQAPAAARSARATDAVRAAAAYAGVAAVVAVAATLIPIATTWVVGTPGVRDATAAALRPDSPEFVLVAVTAGAAFVATLTGGEDMPLSVRVFGWMAASVHALAGYALVMSLLGWDVVRIVEAHIREGGFGIPVYEGLVACTPWALLIVCAVIGAGLVAAGRAGAFGAAAVGSVVLLLDLPYLAAKVLVAAGVPLFG